jgi:hypothetical protein
VLCWRRNYVCGVAFDAHAAAVFCSRNTSHRRGRLAVDVGTATCVDAVETRGTHDGTATNVVVYGVCTHATSLRKHAALCDVRGGCVAVQLFAGAFDIVYVALGL